MKILITGATGFIGTYLVNALKAKYEVYAIVRQKKLGDHKDFSVIESDLKDQSLSNFPMDIDTIIHFAQSSEYKNFPGNAEDIFAVNVASTARLLDCAVKTGVKNFIFASTGSVYEPYMGGLNESDPLNPKSYYAVTKRASELLCHAYDHLLSICTLRLFFPYGEGQKDKLIPNLIDSIQNEKPIHLTGSPEGMVLCPTYVRDIVNVCDVILQERWKGIYNIANPEMISMRTLCEKIGRSLGKSPHFIETPGVALKIQPSLTKLREVFDMSKFHSVDYGLDKIFKG